MQTAVDNTIFVTKGGFIHKRFYRKLLDSEEYAPARALVDKYTTGEDMLMSAVWGGREVLVVMPPSGFHPIIHRAQDSHPQQISSEGGGGGGGRGRGSATPATADADSLALRAAQHRQTIRAELMKLGVQLVDRREWYVLPQQGARGTDTSAGHHEAAGNPTAAAQVITDPCCTTSKDQLVLMCDPLPS